MQMKRLIRSVILGDIYLEASLAARLAAPGSEREPSSLEK
eukprot:gene1276-733_t